MENANLNYRMLNLLPSVTVASCKPFFLYTGVWLQAGLIEVGEGGEGVRKRRGFLMVWEKGKKTLKKNPTITISEI